MIEATNTQASILSDMNRLDRDTDIARINADSATMQSAHQINSSMDIKNTLNLSNSEKKPQPLMSATNITPVSIEKAYE